MQFYKLNRKNEASMKLSKKDLVKTHETLLSFIILINIEKKSVISILQKIRAVITVKWGS